MKPSKLAGAAAILSGLVAFAQSPVESFEVASVKPTAREDFYHLKRECSNERFVAGGMPLSFLIEWSFRMPGPRIVGLPAWSTQWENAYDFEAKSATRLDDDRCRQMVRNLLKDRFAMASHLETRVIPVYLLTLGPHGPKLKSAGGGVRFNGARAQAFGEHEAAAGFSMARLAAWLSGNPAVEERPVIDKTGLTGTYSFDLTYSTRDGDDRPSIFTAIKEQLGLELKAGKAATEILAIDRLEKPTEND